MILKFKIKPTVKKFNHKPSVREIIGDDGFYQFTNTHSGWTKTHGPSLSNSNSKFYGIRMEKHRKKCIGYKKVTDAEGRIKNKYKYQPAFWLVHLYIIPVKFLDTLGLHAVQYGLKTFSIKQIKKI